MKILLLTPQLPYPPHQGTTLRNYHILRGLALEHDITLLSFTERPYLPGSTQHIVLSDLCEAVEAIPMPTRTKRQRLWQMLLTQQPDMAHRLYTAAFENSLRSLLANTQFDIVQVEGLELARYISTICQASPHSKIVFDDHNAEMELQRRAMLTDFGNLRRWPVALYSWIQVGRLRKFEKWACDVADWATAVSPTDQAHLQTLSDTPISVIPNCIDVTQYQNAEISDSDYDITHFDLLFTGKMDYRPNVDAVIWFAEQVWPQIVGKRPSTTWAIVGKKPHPRLNVLNEQPGITVTGWVESVQPYLQRAGLFIAPFRIGSGTRLKLIEAMAIGLPIVSTTVGAEGFGVVNGREMFLIDDPAEMAATILRLLGNPAEGMRMGETAVHFAKRYDWRIVIPDLEEIYEVIWNTRDDK